MPDPITPLGASLVWIPHILPGWGNAYIKLDSFTPAELAGEEASPVAGFMYGYTRSLPLEQCGRLGSIAAAEVISHVGPRPLVELRTLLP